LCTPYLPESLLNIYKMKILYLLIIAGLIIYIIFLHFQMVRKSIFIDSTVKKLTGIEKHWTMDELLKFLDEIKKLSFYSSFFKDKLFEDETLGYILENVSDSKIYIHYTKNEADAKSIIKDGFRFVESFYKTALPISNDKLDLVIKHNSRRYFGDYMIIICISNKIVNLYSSELDKAGITDYFIENILTETLPVKNENSDLVFLLSEHFVKGFINHTTGEIVRNPDFNPEHSSPGFMDNINRIKESSRKILYDKR
jgi:hypothetical protein